MNITRQAYAEMFGPTVGDRVRLADTELWIEVEHDCTIYGEEVKFGGGKVIRDGMGQSQRVSAEVADTVITNALIVDAVAASSRPTSASRTGAFPPSARPAIRTCSRASPSPSAPAPRSSPAKA